MIFKDIDRNTEILNYSTCRIYAVKTHSAISSPTSAPSVTCLLSAAPQNSKRVFCPKADAVLGHFDFMLNFKNKFLGQIANNLRENPNSKRKHRHNRNQKKKLMSKRSGGNQQPPLPIMGDINRSIEKMSLEAPPQSAEAPPRQTQFNRNRSFFFRGLG